MLIKFIFTAKEKRPLSSHLYLEDYRIKASKVANLEPPIQTTSSSTLGRFCVKKTVPRGHAGMLMYNSFWWNAIRLFNTLRASINNFSRTDMSVFKRNVDYFLCSVKDVPYESFSDNNDNDNEI